MFLYLYISGMITLAFILRLDLKQLNLFQKIGKIGLIFFAWPAFLSIMLITLYDIYGNIDDED